MKAQIAVYKRTFSKESKSLASTTKFQAL